MKDLNKSKGIMENWIREPKKDFNCIYCRILWTV